MKIGSFVKIPQIKHSLKLRTNSVNKYFSAVKTWVRFANQRIVALKTEKGNIRILTDRAEKFGEGISSVKKDLAWLEVRGFADDKVDDALLTLQERLDSLFADLDSRVDVRFDRDSDLW